MKYAELTETCWPFIIGCWILVLFWCSFLLFARDFREKKTLPLILRNTLYIIFGMFLYLFFQCVPALQYKKTDNPLLKMASEIFGELSLGTIIFICVIITLYEIGLHLYNIKWRRTHITDASIKEAVDSLPSGIIIYNRNGKLKLKNTTMENISFSITGDFLLNGLRFEKAVFAGNITNSTDCIPAETKTCSSDGISAETKNSSSDGIPAETKNSSSDGIPAETKNSSSDSIPAETKNSSSDGIPAETKTCSSDGILQNESDKHMEPEFILGEGTDSAANSRKILTLPDGTIQSFNKSVISYGSHTYNMLTASDVTEEYVRTKILDKKREAVRSLNSRLNEYNRNILSVITAREILNAKIKIHDELGAGLLQIKNYLQNGGNAEERELIKKRITGNIGYLKEESETENSDEYKLIITTAASLGVTITIDGVLPDTQPYKHILATALHECFTNTLRYAKGNRLTINLNESDGSLHAELTNNGLPPQNEIIEKGGLSSLRNLTEQAGGTMRIQSFPAFTLFIDLPKGETYVI